MRAVRAFDYPASRLVRDRIRKGEHIADEDRGVIVEVKEGQDIEPPDDLRVGWVLRGLVEVSDANKVKR